MLRQVFYALLTIISVSNYPVPLSPEPIMASDERQPLVTMEQLAVIQPARNTQVNGTNHSIWGHSVPGLPLSLNGEPITHRTAEGFFAVFYPLEPGENHLVFSQPGQPDVERIIFRGHVTADEAHYLGITLPAPAPAPAPVQPLHTFPPDQFYYATVMSPLAWLFPQATTAGASHMIVEQGMTDRILAQRGNWLQLANGHWIQAAHVTRFSQTEAIPLFLQGQVNQSDHLFQVTFDVLSTHVPIARAIFDPETNSITSYFGLSAELTEITGLDHPAFVDHAYGTNTEGVPYLRLALDPAYRVSGFDWTADHSENSQLTLTIRTPRPLSPVVNQPFDGFTFVIDPGHGGTDPGAIGPMGMDMAEKHLVLLVSEKLRTLLIDLGATVVMTRYDNETTLTLHERIVTSRNTNPDLFLSMHGNSVAVTSDAMNIRGFTIWTRNDNSYPVSRLLLDHMLLINPETNRHDQVNRANFYVTRPTWAPHTLLEFSFLSSIDDFVWMLDPVNQERLANYTVWGLLDYFR